MNGGGKRSNQKTLDPMAPFRLDSETVNIGIV